MNDLIQFLQSHASVRKFTDQPVTEEQERLIVKTAQQSPTSSNLQAYSIISVRDRAAKTALSELSGGQQHVIDCAVFLVFCADLFRLKRVSDRAGYPCHCEYTEMFILATVDAALTASRALIAAQALELGGVMVGGIRNHPEKVSELLKLPALVYPVMGMSLGYPAVKPKIKPRLPLDAVLFHERYQPESIDRGIDEYDQIINEGGHLKGRPIQPEKYPKFAGLYSWSEHSARRLADTAPTALRPHMRDFLEKRGFLKK